MQNLDTSSCNSQTKTTQSALPGEKSPNPFCLMKRFWTWGKKNSWWHILLSNGCYPTYPFGKPWPNWLLHCRSKKRTYAMSKSPLCQSSKQPYLKTHHTDQPVPKTATVLHTPDQWHWKPSCHQLHPKHTYKKNTRNLNPESGLPKAERESKQANK